MYEQEVGELNSIKNSKVLRNLLDKHKIQLQKGVNEAVRDNDITKAYGELAKLDDIDRIMGLIQLRITELMKGEK